MHTVPLVSRLVTKAFQIQGNKRRAALTALTAPPPPPKISHGFFIRAIQTIKKPNKIDLNF